MNRISPVEVELARIDRAAKIMPAVTERYDDIVRSGDGGRLWRTAVADAQNGHLDDRPLYWARLKLRRALGEPDAVEVAERLSRNFEPDHPPGVPKVLVTGFDPFHLDDMVEQSNPSGLVALALDGTTIAGAHVRSAILPVRFQAFDQGIVEDLLRPLFQRGLELAVTVSMGRRGPLRPGTFPGTPPFRGNGGQLQRDHRRLGIESRASRPTSTAPGRRNSSSSRCPRPA